MKALLKALAVTTLFAAAAPAFADEVVCVYANIPTSKIIADRTNSSACKGNTPNAFVIRTPAATDRACIFSTLPPGYRKVADISFLSNCRGNSPQGMVISR